MSAVVNNLNKNVWAPFGLVVLLLLVALAFIQKPQESQVFTETQDPAAAQLVEDYGFSSEDILSGGVGKDGIPSIDNPQFTNISVAQEWLEEENMGISLRLNGEEIFYPFRILVWHEIVNDVVGDSPIAVTYCPLCRTGVVVSRELKDKSVVEFGVSGKLWKSNVLMYDRQENEEDETLWSQVLRTGVVGPRAGEKLEIIPSDIISFSDWVNGLEDSENAKVLSRDNTGAIRNYSADPYGDYYTNTEVSFGATFDFVNEPIHPKEIVIGVLLPNGETRAFQKNMLPEILEDGDLVITKSENNNITIENKKNGRIVDSIEGFWFSWKAAHPETTLWSP